LAKENLKLNTQWGNEWRVKSSFAMDVTITSSPDFEDETVLNFAPLSTVDLLPFA
jgi:hypothetical protein